MVLAPKLGACEIVWMPESYIPMTSGQGKKALRALKGQQSLCDIKPQVG